jgi:hypothetical protein
MIIHTFHLRSSLHFPSLHITSLQGASHHFTSHSFPSLHIPSLHFTSRPFTPLHNTWLHFTSHPFPSFHLPLLPFMLLHITSLHIPSLHFTSHHITSQHYASLHITSLNFAWLQITSLTALHSLFFSSLHFWWFCHRVSKPLHLSSLIITSLTPFTKTCDLQRKVSFASACSWLQYDCPVYKVDIYRFTSGRILYVCVCVCVCVCKRVTTSSSYCMYACGSTLLLLADQYHKHKKKGETSHGDYHQQNKQQWDFQDVWRFRTDMKPAEGRTAT